MDVLRQERTYTIDEIYALPDGERAELIDGKIYYMSLPSKTDVREYWIVDPTKEQIMVYWFGKETMEQYSFGEEVPVGIYDGFQYASNDFCLETVLEIDEDVTITSSVEIRCYFSKTMAGARKEKILW